MLIRCSQNYIIKEGAQSGKIELPIGNSSRNHLSTDDQTMRDPSDPNTTDKDIMAQAQGFGRKYIKAFFKGFFVAVPVTVTFLDRVACVARVEGASMQPSLNPGERQVSDVVLLNHWSIRNYEVQRGDIVSLVSPKNPEQKIIKRVIALEGDIVKTSLKMGFVSQWVPGKNRMFH
ncbi:mitochondrial inner membrane protease subunit 2 isoform X2 [Trachemys scripta elegans]|nr:mitochondrial inner membrane protease subunit 2 isoform X2 [Trachemys scripta elegans]